MRDENGLEKCVACGLCAVACPADAIYLEAAENDGTRPGRSALREGLPDPQDALHLLRLLRRGLPGVGDLHGQGLRARGLQQQGLHLGQDRPARAGAATTERRRRAARPRDSARSATSTETSRASGGSWRGIPTSPVWLCVGDVADDGGRYEPFGAPVYWIQGQQRELRRDRRRRPAGRPALTSRTGRLTSDRGVCASPVSAAPSRRAGTRRRPADLPHPEKGTPKATELADKRRHFVREEVEACKALRGVDVFLTHEAPRPFRRRRGDRRAGNDAGKTPINEVLAAMQPRLHLFGHHHRFSRTGASRACGRSASIWSSQSYLLIDARTLDVSAIVTIHCRTHVASRHFSRSSTSRVLVCDGAMGTMLYAQGMFLNRSFDELNLTQPDLVAEVHQAYVRAGADVIETNTFGANRIKLATFGLADQVHAINLQGAKIARHAARDQRLRRRRDRPARHPHRAVGQDRRRRGGGVLPRAGARRSLEGGVDLFVLETFRDVNEIGAAIRAVRSVCDLPIVAQMTTEEDGNTPRRRGAGAVRAGARTLGARRRRPELQRRPGGDARDDRADGARRARCKLSAQPNAGRPREIEGRNIYLCSPEYMASYARRFINSGVRLVGGCCGTTPEHIRQIKMAVRVACRRRAAARSRAATRRGGRGAAGTVPPVAARGEVADGQRARARRRSSSASSCVPPRGYPGRRAGRAGAAAADPRRRPGQHSRTARAPARA